MEIVTSKDLDSLFSAAVPLLLRTSSLTASRLTSLLFAPISTPQEPLSFAFIFHNVHLAAHLSHTW